MALLSGNASAAYANPHAPIWINGDLDFATQASSEGWLGSGTDVDPYIISDYYIDCSASNGITIQNTRVHFTILEVATYQPEGTFANCGVYLANVWNADITYVISTQNNIGLYAWNCNWINITGGATDPGFGYGLMDYSYNAAKGIYLSHVNNCVINPVNAWYNNAYGLYATTCNNLQVLNGQFDYNTGTGAYIVGCPGAVITNCMFGTLLYAGNGWNGLDVRSSDGAEISGVTSVGNSLNGINLRSSDSIALANCIVGDPLTTGMFNMQNGLYAYLCSNTVITDVMAWSNQKSGIYLLSCTDSVITGASTNSQTSNYLNGIYLSSCVGATIETGYVDSNNGNGISIASSSYVEVIDTVASNNNLNGINAQSSSYVDIMDDVDYNDVNNNHKNGLSIVGCSNVGVSGGVFSYNYWHGIYAISCPTGLSIDGSVAGSNGYNGIHLASCPGVIVSGCDASGNPWNGIYIKQSNGAAVSGSITTLNSQSGMYIVLSNDVSVTGCDSEGNTRDGIYFGTCTNAVVDATTTSINNGWYGVKALGCVNVDTTGATLTPNSYGDFYWPNAAPIAKFTVKRIDMINGPITLNASASYDLDGSIAAYLWDYGDGNTGTVTSAVSTHTYATMDNYVVGLVVRDNLGRYSSKTQHDLAVQTELCAKFIIPNRALVGDSVALDASLSYSLNPARTIVAYEWDFDDGTPLGSGVSPSHAWTVEDSYQVKLRVQDDIGRWSPVMTARIVIGTDDVVALSVSASRHALLLNEEVDVTITAVDSVGNKVTSCGDTVKVSANRSGAGWTGIPSEVTLIGGEATFTASCSATDNYNISAYVDGSPAICGAEHVSVASTSIELRVYDLAQMALGKDFGVDEYKNYWNPSWRGKWGDQPWRYEVPAINLYATGTDLLKSNIDTTYRFNLEARNVSSINMADPTFFPRMNTGPGGNFSWTWDYDYLNLDQFYHWNDQNKPPIPPKSYGYNETGGSNLEMTWSLKDQVMTGTYAFALYNTGDSAYDGWETLMRVNITMDRDAAWQLIGLPKTNPDPLLWWDRWDPGHGHGNDSVTTAWMDFMIAEGGGTASKGRLDIRSCDDGYPWQAAFWGNYQTLSYDAINDEVTMNVMRVGYGEDTLLCRWLYWGGVSNGWNYPDGTPGGILTFEPYMDQFRMSGKMNSSAADVTVDAGVIYGWRSHKSVDPSVPSTTAVWRWEQVLIDYAGSTGEGAWDRSEMDPWVQNGLTFDIWDPAGTSFGITIAADQTPNAIYLEAGESIVIEKPRVPVNGIMNYPLVGDPTEAGDRDKSGYNKWIGIVEKYGYPTIHQQGCGPYSNGDARSVLDAGTGDLVFVGPFNPMVNYYPSPYDDIIINSAPLIEMWLE